MRFDVITLFPEMFQSLEYGVVGKALRNRLIELHCWNPRDFTHDPHRTVDDRPYGGGPGMVMKVEPLHQAIITAKNADPRPTSVILLSPQGKTLTQEHIAAITKSTRLILVAGRY